MTIVMVVVAGIIGLAILNSVMTTTSNLSAGSMGEQNMSGSGITLNKIGYAIESGTIIVMNSTDNAVITTSFINKDYNTGVINCTTSERCASLKNVTWTYMSKDGYSSSLSRTIGIYVVPIGLLGLLAIAAMIAL